MAATPSTDITATGSPTGTAPSICPSRAREFTGSVFGFTRIHDGRTPRWRVQVHHVNDIDKVIAYHRWAGGGPRDDVLVVANFADRRYDTYTVGAPRGGAWQIRFCSDDTRYDSAFDGHCPQRDTGAIPGL